MIIPGGVPAGRASSRRHLLNDLQQAIIGVANAIGGNPGTPLSETMRVFAAIEHMKRAVRSSSFRR